MDMNNNKSGILAGIFGAVFLLGSFLFFHLQLLVSLILGAAGYIGSALILSSFKQEKQLEIKFSDVTPQMLESTLKDGRDKIKILEGYASKISEPGVVKKVEHIIDIINRIFENFKKDPKDIKIAKQFLSYYFDSTLKIVNMYVDLSNQKVHTPEIEVTLSKAENMLNSIAMAYEKLLSKLLEDDIMNLDVEIETLEKTFRAENLK